MRESLAPLTALVILAAAPTAAHADWSLSAAAGVNHDNNVGNAQAASDIVQDYALNAHLSLYQLVPLSGDWSLAVGADLTGEAYDQLDGLNNASIEGAVSLKKKWGLGALAPWVRAQISLGRAAYQDGYRDATLYSASLQFGKRIDERWNLSAQYSFERRAATPGPEVVPGHSADAFSLSGNNVGATVEFSLSERISLTAGALWRHGDVTSTSLIPWDYLFVVSTALAPDPTFGPDAYAYRLTGTTYGVKLGAEFFVTAHSTIGCGFERLETRAEGGNNYLKSVPEITWNYRF
jgi:hypothetical protein